MRTFHENDIRRRAKILSFALAAWAAVVALRLVQVQVFGHARAKATVLRQTQDTVPVETRRGDILDRNGEILACSLPAVSVYIQHIDGDTPAEERDKVRALKAALDLSAKEAALVQKRLDEGYGFTYVKRKVPTEDGARVAALKLHGVGLEPATRRHYPLGSLAAHVIGGVSLTGENGGGVEARFNALLQGKEGRQIVAKINRGRNYRTQVLESPIPGRDLVLTIDATIQYYAEKELALAVAQHEAFSGAVVVMEPESGDILAMASLPAYDVNRFPGPKEAWLNRAVSATYEPGSTFKIVTAAAARERNRVGFSELFDCSAGFIRVGGTTITDHERENVLSFPQVLIKSSNVGTVLFAQRISIPEFHETIKAFGLGARTGIDLPAEEPGKVRPPGEWNRNNSLAHVAIGYEISVTPLQMLQAMNVFAIGGQLVPPRIVRDDGAPAAAPVRAISERTASELVGRVFVPVVEEGTAKLGRLDGYRIAGKTGTAQKYDPAVRAYTRTYTASFVGFTPVERPRLAMIVVLDRPKEGYYGGQVCAPVFRDIAKQVLRYLRVPPERPMPSRVLTAGMAVGRRP